MRVPVLILLLLAILPCLAQQKPRYILSGKVSDGQQFAVYQATVQILSTRDSSQVSGLVTDEAGSFKVNVPKGRYILKTSYVGFKASYYDIRMDRNMDISITLEEDDIILGDAVVTAKAPAIQVVEDTVMFNSTVYKVQEDAMAEDLVRKIPGAELDENKNITIHGRKVKRLMVNGKEFFGNDVKSGLKSISADLIEQIKVYERQSDMARLSGVDDGEEEMVLDLIFKPEAQHGISGRISGAYGTHDRYMSRINANRFSDKDQLTIVGGANNVNDKSIAPEGVGRRGDEDSDNGLFTVRNLGLTYAKHTDRMELGGHVNYRYSNNDLHGRSNIQNMQKSRSSYSSTNSSQLRRNESTSSEFRLEYKLSETLRMVIRPSVSLTSTSNLADRLSGNFNDDPYALVDNPNLYLNTEEIEKSDPLREIRQNNTRNLSHSIGQNFKSSLIAQLTKRLNRKGRSLTVQMSIGNGSTKNDLNSDVTTRYYKIKSNPDSVSYVRRYTHAPGSYWTWSAQITYNEPIAKKVYLQFRYRFQFRSTEYDRSVYDLGLVDPTWRLGASVADGFEKGLVSDLSKSSRYDYYQHQINVGVRVSQKKLNMTAGFNLQPQVTRLSYRSGEFMTDTVRHILNMSPQIEMRYRFSKSEQFRLTYRGRPQQPNMDRLLPTVDNSNPLNVKIGNPGLKPSFTHSVELLYNVSNFKKQHGLVVSGNVNVIENAQSNSTTYDEQTGGKTTQMQNINGNWNARMNVNYTTGIFNRALDLKIHSMMRYDNQVSFLYNKELKADERNLVTDLTLGEDIMTTWRNDRIELNFQIRARYDVERSRLQENNNENPYLLSYGLSGTLPLVSGIEVTSFIEHQFQGGYRDTSLNRSYLIWNLQLSRKFLKRRLVASVDFYDILRQVSNVRRNLTSERRQVSIYNNINSYCLFRLTYKFK